MTTMRKKRKVLTRGVTVVPVLPVGQFTATELRALARLIVEEAGNSLCEREWEDALFDDAKVLEEQVANQLYEDQTLDQLMLYPDERAVVIARVGAILGRWGLGIEDTTVE